VVTAVPLVTLTVSTVHLASDALIHDVMERVDQTADLAASVVQEDFRGLSGLVDSVAGQADLVAAMADPATSGRRLEEHLTAVQSAHQGIDAVLVTDPAGSLVAMVPPNPGLLGSQVQYQGWYKEVTAIGRPSVSSAFLNPWPDRKSVV